MNARALALLALSLVACGGDGLGAMQPEPVCGLALVPAPELVAEVAAAAERWSVATGCSIRIERGGYRVRLVEPMFTRSGAEQPGLTHWLDSGELVIDVTEARSGAVLPHELGHLLLASRGVKPDPVHLLDGFSLMASGGGEGFITEADLGYACSGFPCALRVPEI